MTKNFGWRLFLGILAAVVTVIVTYSVWWIIGMAGWWTLVGILVLGMTVILLYSVGWFLDAKFFTDDA